MASPKVYLETILHNVAVNSGLPKRQVKIMVDKLISAMAVEMKKGNRVMIIGFGQFIPKNVAPTAGPFKKGPAASLRTKTVRFKPATRLRDYLSGVMPED